jgi:hypothetical protein
VAFALGWMQDSIWNLGLLLVDETLGLVLYWAKIVPGTRAPGTRIRPQVPGICRVIGILYPSCIRRHLIRVVSVSVPNLKIPVFVSEKASRINIRIRYPNRVPDPFSPLLASSRAALPWGTGQSGEL